MFFFFFYWHRVSFGFYCQCVYVLNGLWVDRLPLRWMKKEAVVYLHVCEYKMHNNGIKSNI